MQKKLIIHYTCASLDPGLEAYITAISVYDLETMEEFSFSLYEEKKDLNEASIEVLEAKVLEKFFTFAATCSDALWMHWHMDSPGYGFAVLEERYKLLSQKKAPKITHKVDLADMFYVSYKDECSIYPKMLPLIRANKLPTLKILSGEEEAKAYTKGKYKKVQTSSLNKVLVMANLYHRMEADTLTTPCQMRNNHLMIITLSIVGLLLWMIFGR